MASDTEILLQGMIQSFLLKEIFLERKERE